MTSKKEAKRAADVAEAYAHDWTVELELDPGLLPENPSETSTAQNYLASALLSVENALSAASQQRAIQLAYEGKAPSGSDSTNTATACRTLRSGFLSGDRGNIWGHQLSCRTMTR